MPIYKAIFRVPGGEELKATRGYVPDIFFDAIQNVTLANLVETYEGGFTLSNEMHEKLNVREGYASYASVAKYAPEGDNFAPDFNSVLLTALKEANHARPLEDNLNYQIFIMEYIDSPPEDD